MIQPRIFCMEPAAIQLPPLAVHSNAGDGASLLPSGSICVPEHMSPGMFAGPPAIMCVSGAWAVSLPLVPDASGMLETPARCSFAQLSNATASQVVPATSLMGTVVPQPGPDVVYAVDCQAVLNPAANATSLQSRMRFITASVLQPPVVSNDASTCDATLRANVAPVPLPEWAALAGGADVAWSVAACAIQQSAALQASAQLPGGVYTLHLVAVLRANDGGSLADGDGWVAPSPFRTPVVALSLVDGSTATGLVLGSVVATSASETAALRSQGRLGMSVNLTAVVNQLALASMAAARAICAQPSWSPRCNTEGGNTGTSITLALSATASGSAASAPSPPSILLVVASTVSDWSLGALATSEQAIAQPTGGEFELPVTCAWVKQSVQHPWQTASLNSSSSIAQRMVVSRGLPGPTALVLELSTPPSPGETVRASCAVAGDLDGWRLQLIQPLSTTRSNFRPLRLEVDIGVAPEAGDSPAFATVTCEIISESRAGGRAPSFAAIAPVSAAITLLPARLQLFDDLLLIERNATIRSVWSERRITTSIDAAAIASANTAACANCVQVSSNATEALLRALATEEERRQRPFVLTLGGATQMVFKARIGARFVPTTTVWFGTTPVPISWVSVDGQWAKVTSPPLPPGCGRSANDDPLCTADGAVLSFDSSGAALTVDELSAVAEDGPLALSLLQLLDGNFRVVAPLMRCPPACPPLLEATDLITTLRSTRSVDLSLATTVPFELRPRQLRSSVAKGVVRYTRDCTPFGFLPAGSPQCLNASSPEFGRCARVVNDTCRACPPGCACAAGPLCWPLAGFRVYDASLDNAVQCAMPSTERCLGWDVGASAMQCGAGYTGPGCRQCSSGYYWKRAAGRCVACNVGQVTWAALGPLVLMLAGLTGVGAVLGVLAYVLARWRQQPLTPGQSAKRAIHFMASAYASIQVSLLQMAGGPLPA